MTLVLAFALILTGALLIASGVQNRTITELLKGFTAKKTASEVKVEQAKAKATGG